MTLVSVCRSSALLPQSDAEIYYLSTGIICFLYTSSCACCIWNNCANVRTNAQMCLVSGLHSFHVKETLLGNPNPPITFKHKISCPPNTCIVWCWSTGTVNTAGTRARHWTRFRPSFIHFSSSQLVALKSTWMPTSDLLLRCPSGCFPRYVSTNNLYTSILSDPFYLWNPSTSDLLLRCPSGCFPRYVSTNILHTSIPSDPFYLWTPS
jgi:hypothetical protein